MEPSAVSSLFDDSRFADYPLTVLAFHGTSREVAEEVFAGRAELTVSRHSWEWLGDGVYFWENGPERALQWAKDRGKKEPTVVGAIVQIGHCLNLMDKSSNLPVSEAYNLCVKMFADSKKQMPKNLGKLHELDALVINTLHLTLKDIHRQYDTVRAAYIEGDPLYEGTELRTDTHIQLCVRDPKKSIVAYFRPRLAGDML